MSSHEEIRERLPAAALDELDEAQRKEIETHVQTCGDCRDELKRIRAVLAAAERIRDAKLDDEACREAGESVLKIVADLEARRQKQHSWLKYAAAAVLIAGVWLILQHFMGSQKLPSPPQAHHDPSVQPAAPDTTPAQDTRAQRLQKERALARAFYERGNTAGLITLLRTGLPSAKPAVADYLADIGDASAIAPLEELASEWQGPADENPYKKAIEAIRRRLAEEAAAPEPTGFNPSTTEEPQLPSEVLSEELTEPTVKKDDETLRDIYVKILQEDGEERDVIEEWIRLPNLYRRDTGQETVIDDGRRQLKWNHQEKTAQFSYSRKTDLTEEDGYRYAVMFQRGKPDIPESTEVISLSGPDTKVYDFQEHTTSVRAWVDAQSGLTKKVSWHGEDSDTAGEAMFAYLPIEESTFAMQIPPGYTELPEKVPGVFTGCVVDLDGYPLSGAKVFVSARPILTSAGPLEGISNEKGEFSVLIHPEKMPVNQDSLGSPVVIWTQLPDRPDLIAWTILQNEYDRQWLPHAEQIVNRVAVVQVSEDYTGGPYDWCRGASNLVLVMEPAGWVTGTVVDPQGKPITGVQITTRFAPAGRSGQPLDHRTDFWKTEALTDAKGYFQVGSLPQLGEKSRLEFYLRADGYAAVHESIELEKPLEILEMTFQMIPTGPAVRGYIKDNYGKPLAGRPVSVGVEGRSISGCRGETDENGFFEIIHCPEGVDLKVTAELNHNPASPNPPKADQEPFVYYPNAFEWIACEPGRQVYEVNLVAILPELIVEVEVTDSQGRPLADFPVEINNAQNPLSPYWRQDAGLIGLTDENGRIRFDRVPETEGLLVAGGIGIHYPKPNELSASYSRRFDQALAACAPYGRIEIPVVPEAGRNEYVIQMKALTREEKQQLQEQNSPQ